jgi:hypothetical protein
MGRPEATERRRDPIGIDRCRLEDRGPINELGHGRGGSAGCRTTLAVKAHPLDSIAAGGHGDPHQVTARSAAGGAAERLTESRPLPGRVAQIFLEDLSVHEGKLKRPQPAVFRPGLVTRVAQVVVYRRPRRDRRKSTPKPIVLGQRLERFAYGLGPGSTLAPWRRPETGTAALSRARRAGTRRRSGRRECRARSPHARSPPSSRFRATRTGARRGRGGPPRCARSRSGRTA